MILFLCILVIAQCIETSSAVALDDGFALESERCFYGVWPWFQVSPDEESICVFTGTSVSIVDVDTCSVIVERMYEGHSPSIGPIQWGCWAGGSIYLGIWKSPDPPGQKVFFDVLDPRDLTDKAEFRSPRGDIYSLTASPSGNHLAFISPNNYPGGRTELCIIRTSDNSLQSSLTLERYQSFYLTSWSRDGSQVAVVSDERLYVYDIASGGNVSYQKKYTRTVDLIFTPDGKGLYSINQDFGVDFYNLTSRSLERTETLPDDISCGDMDFFGGHLCLGRYSDLLVYKMDPFEQVGLHQDTATSIIQAEFLANGSRMATISEDGFLRVYRNVDDPTWNRPPAIEISSPAWGQEVKDDLVARGTITDDGGSVAGSYSLNGGPWIVIATPEEWNFTIGRQDLVQGDNRLTVLAFDGENDVRETVFFRFVGASPPNQPPTVRIVAPADGSEVGDVLVVNGIADDDLGVRLVTVQLADGPWLDATGTNTWSMVTPVPPGVGGLVKVRARAWDGSFSSATAEVSIWIDRSTAPSNLSPRVHLELPIDGTVVLDTVWCKGSTEDDGDGTVTFISFDGGPWSVLSSDATWTAAYPTKEWALGHHVVSFLAFDGESTSAIVDVGVVRRAAGVPTVVIDSPPAGQRFDDTLAVTGHATGVFSPIQRVELRLGDGPWTAAAGNETWSLDLDATGLPLGGLTVQARAWDVQANSTVAEVEVYHTGGSPRATGHWNWPAWLALITITAVVALLLLWTRRRTREGAEGLEPKLLALLVVAILMQPIQLVSMGGAAGEGGYDYVVVREVAGIRGYCHMFTSPDLGSVCLVNSTPDSGSNYLVRVFNLTADRFVAETRLSGFNVQEGCWIDDRILLVTVPANQDDVHIAPILVLSDLNLSVMSREGPITNRTGKDVYFSHLEVSPSGRYLAMFSKELIVLRTSDFGVVRWIDDDFHDYIRSAAWSPDEARIALLSQWVYVYNLGNGTRSRTDRSFMYVGQMVFWSSNADSLYVMDGEELYRFDGTTLEERASKFIEHDLRCWEVRTQPFELLWGSATSIGIVSLPTMDNVKAFRAANGGVDQVIWDPSGHRIVAMTREGVLRIFMDTSAPPTISPPRIEIWRPLAGAVIAGDVVAEGTVTDDIRVLYARWRLNDGAWADLAEPIYWKVEIPLDDMVAGNNTLTVSASDGESVSTASVTFRLDPRAIDNEPPTVAIFSPGEGERVGLVVNVTGVASDDGGVQMVMVRIGDGTWSLAVGTADWAATLLLPKVTQAGNVTIEAKSWDGLFFSPTSRVNVSVEPGSPGPNARPRVVIDSPSEGIAVHDEVTVAGRTDDDSLLVTTYIAVDGGPLEALTIDRVWDRGPMRLGLGAHTITAVAFDGALLSEVAMVNFTLVHDVPLRVVISSPENGTAVSGEVLVSGVVLGGRDPIGPVRVLLDGERATDLGTGRSWQVRLNVTNERPGEHVILVKVIDGLGSSSSANVTITIVPEENGSHEPPQRDLTCLVISILVAAILLATIWYSRRDGAP